MFVNFNDPNDGEFTIMSELITITLPKDMSITERISEVSKELSEWLLALDKPVKIGKDVIYLSHYHVNGGYSYHYSIEREIEG
jgi:hypothetical protein